MGDNYVHATVHLDDTAAVRGGDPADGMGRVVVNVGGWSSTGALIWYSRAAGERLVACIREGLDRLPPDPARAQGLVAL